MHSIAISFLDLGVHIQTFEQRGAHVRRTCAGHPQAIPDRVQPTRILFRDKHLDGNRTFYHAPHLVIAILPPTRGRW